MPNDGNSLNLFFAPLTLDRLTRRTLMNRIRETTASNPGNRLTLHITQRSADMNSIPVTVSGTTGKITVSHDGERLTFNFSDGSTVPINEASDALLLTACRIIEQKKNGK